MRKRDDVLLNVVSGTEKGINAILLATKIVRIAGSNLLPIILFPLFQV